MTKDDKGLRSICTDGKTVEVFRDGEKINEYELIIYENTGVYPVSDQDSV